MTVYFDSSVITKVFRREISERVLTGALADLDTDVTLGVWVTGGQDLFDTFQSAAGMSRRYTPLIGARTMDVLHVASAPMLRATAFVTSDDSQDELAKAVGLNVVRLHTKRPRKAKRRS